MSEDRDESSESWDEAMEDARIELGYSEGEYVSDWDELVEVAQEYHNTIKQREYENFCDYAKHKYHKYLESNKWKVLRNLILKRDNNICLDCKGVAEQVHHLNYDFIHTEKEKEFCVSLCRNCHTARHNLPTKKLIQKKETIIDDVEEKIGYWMDND